MLSTHFRTHHCNALRLDHEGQQVKLCGWIHDIRDKGYLIWIDLRDRYGMTQVIFEKEIATDALFAQAKKWKRETVIQVMGVVVERSAKNDDMATGHVEVRPTAVKLLNCSATPPFLIREGIDAKEPLRMQYRYLDLRRPPLQKNLLFRHQIFKLIRHFLDDQAFIEIETPCLMRSTPEGARDFVVPARLHPSHYYALPQSPQLFKQLLMIAGMDRYYQFAKCFRDEDLRADRQPEFTQLDCEMSFVTPADVRARFEELIQYLFTKIKGVTLPAFPIMTYAQAMRTYGTDKPDLRFGMGFLELNDLTKGYGCPLFDQHELVLGMVVPGGAVFSRKKIDELAAFLQSAPLTARGLFYLKKGMNGYLKSSVEKFFTPLQLAAWAAFAKMRPGDILLIVVGEPTLTQHALGELRIKLGAELGLYDPTHFAPLWVVDFPLLVWDAQAQRYHATHHPFTAPKEEDAHLLVTAPGKVRANAYDLVINGAEIGGGSIRIHDPAQQKALLKLLGFSSEAMETQFGFFIKALHYGTPPHGGIAIGMDRLCAIMAHQEVIRDFIAFPKNNAGRDVMMDAPAPLPVLAQTEVNE